MALKTLAFPHHIVRCGGPMYRGFVKCKELASRISEEKVLSHVACSVLPLEFLFVSSSYLVTFEPLGTPPVGFR